MSTQKLKIVMPTIPGLDLVKADKVVEKIDAMGVSYTKIACNFLKNHIQIWCATLFSIKCFVLKKIKFFGVISIHLT